MFLVEIILDQQFQKNNVQFYRIKLMCPVVSGAARVLNQNLQEIRQKNLLNKRELIRKLPAKNVRFVVLLRICFIVSVFTETNPRSSEKD